MKKSRSVLAATVLASAPLAAVEAQTSPAAHPASVPTVSYISLLSSADAATPLWVIPVAKGGNRIKEESAK